MRQLYEEYGLDANTQAFTGEKEENMNGEEGAHVYVREGCWDRREDGET